MLCTADSTLETTLAVRAPSSTRISTGALRALVLGCLAISTPADVLFSPGISWQLLAASPPNAVSPTISVREKAPAPTSTAPLAAPVDAHVGRVPASTELRFNATRWDCDSLSQTLTVYLATQHASQNEFIYSAGRTPWIEDAADASEPLPSIFDEGIPVLENVEQGRIVDSSSTVSGTPPGRDPLIPNSSASKTDAKLPGNSSSGGRAPFTMGGFWALPTKVQGQDTDLGMNMQSVNVGFPLRRPDEKGMWLGIVNFDRLELSSHATLPGTTQPVPSQLWSLQFGTLHTRQLDNGWNVGGMFLFGSASDRPFAAFRDLTMTTALFANHPARNERDSWSVSLFYSPTSQLPYPLPGIAYVWRPTPALEASLGVPASLTYRPTEASTLALTYMPLTNFGARATQSFHGGWSLYSAYEIYNETYFLDARVETQERFYVFDQRVVLGFERAIRAGFALDFAVLYLFDRQLFQGVNFSSGREDTLRFNPGIGVNAQLIWRR